MVVANNTIQGIEKVLERNLDPETIARIITQLYEVPGNQSWRDGIRLLKEKYAPDYPVRPPATPTQ